MTDIKWRGIKTTQVKKNETEPKTITNRFGQKSLSLPRIDDKKRWAGYPGISGISKKIANIIPKHDLIDFYIEPFAGTAKVYQELIKRGDVQVTNLVLNDTASFIYKWLKKEFPEAIVTQQDFIECVKVWDSPKSFFMFDQPWFTGSYDQDFSSFNRDSIAQYDNEILDLCQNLQGKFIITTRKENTRMLNSGYNCTLIKSEYCVCGHYPRVLITTNLNEKELFPKMTHPD